MKRVKWLLIALLLITTLNIKGCKSTPQTEIVLPEKPCREKLETPQTLQDYAEILIYYDCLVQKWELWAETVEKITQGEESGRK